MEKTMDGYCMIEKKTTIWKKLPNGKWICISPNCSGIRGQYETPPQKPKIPNHLKEAKFDYVI